ncbi:MAG: hypothetical protein LBC94_08555 [Desulfovibrio sp.]|jgi:hypothetical protein|nr:hypothetical protein [Desulfovibrio sp.]
MSVSDFVALVGQDLAPSLLRLFAGLVMGLLLASVLEALNWVRFLAKLAKPLARAARLSESARAAFALSFISPAAANSLLANAHSGGLISGRELMLANLFNSLPAYLLHTPSIFLLAWPVLGLPAALYVGLTLLAATARTGFTIILGALLLPGPQNARAAHISAAAPAASLPPAAQGGARGVALKILRRFTRRLPSLVLFTVPVYVLMHVLQRMGQFDLLEAWLAAHMAWLDFLKPEAMTVVALHLAAEFGPALGAAGFALQSGALTPRDIVLALMVGNILSTPVRALRHQLPSYSGFYRPALALKLILASQGFRAASMALMTAAYWWCTAQNAD